MTYGTRHLRPLSAETTDTPKPSGAFLVEQSGAARDRHVAPQDRFCTGAMADGSPGFDIANWMTKLLYAYDYVGRDGFSES